MNFSVDKSKINMSGEQIMRKAGYGFIRDYKTGKESFVRRLGNMYYPRLHMYVTEEAGRLEFSLHLDQKQASYAGSHMHSAEYDGEMVESEINRLKQLILQLANQQIAPSSDHSSAADENPWYKFW